MENPRLSERYDETDADAYRKSRIEYPQLTEYYKNRGGWQLSSRSKSNVRHKRCIGASFRLGGMPDSPQ